MRGAFFFYCFPVTSEGACFGLVTAFKAPKVFSSRWHPYHAERAHVILSRGTTESVTQRTMLTGFPIKLGVNRRSYAVYQKVEGKQRGSPGLPARAGNAAD